jgi:carbon monoxide dehydrogenase subunit G
MAHYQSTFEVPAAPADAFAYLADFTNAVQWDPGTVESTRADDGPLGVGARFRVVVAFFGRRIPLEYVIEQYEPDRRLVLGVSGKSVTGRDTITITPSGTGSTIGYEADLNLKGAMRVLDKGLQVTFTNIGNKASDSLKKSLGG